MKLLKHLNRTNLFLKKKKNNNDKIKKSIFFPKKMAIVCVRVCTELYDVDNRRCATPDFFSLQDKQNQKQKQK